MFIPLHDINPMRRLKRPIATYGLIGFTICVHLIIASGVSGVDMDRAAIMLGTIPAVITGAARLPAEYSLLPEKWTFLTALFLHAGWLHLLSNMLFLWVFGDNVEDAMGSLRFLAFYLICGVMAGLGHVAFATGSPRPLIGASGAIAGIVGAYLILYPRVSVFGLVFNRIPFVLKAAYAIGLWIVFQAAMLIFGWNSDVSWAAHVTGFAAGAMLVGLFVVKGTPLFPWHESRPSS